jgi:hypothetical protein
MTRVGNEERCTRLQKQEVARALLEKRFIVTPALNFLYRLINVADTKNDLLFFVSTVRDNRYLKLILGIGCLYQPLLPKIFRSPRDASQKYLHPLARPHPLDPKSLSLSLSLSTPPAQLLSIAPGQGWRRGATPRIDQPRGSCCTPLFFPIGASAPPFFSNIVNGRGRHGGA